MSETQRTIANVTVIETTAERETAGWRFIYAPGAGSHVNDPFGAFACATLAERGVPAARFQFPYQQAGSRRPDRPIVLQETWLAVLDALLHLGKFGVHNLTSQGVDFLLECLPRLIALLEFGVKRLVDVS